nr:MAG TPA: hypothetical protein [Caudoviricetes sp.]
MISGIECLTRATIHTEHICIAQWSRYICSSICIAS